MRVLAAESERFRIDMIHGRRNDTSYTYLPTYPRRGIAFRRLFRAGAALAKRENFHNHLANVNQRAVTARRGKRNRGGEGCGGVGVRGTIPLESGIKVEAREACCAALARLSYGQRFIR